MATKTLQNIFCLFISCFINAVQGYYCDNDKCLEEEFCCGENICCVSYKVWELWYFWCGIIFFMFLLSMCACFWRQRSRAYWVFRTPGPFNPLSPDEDAKYKSGLPDQYVTGIERASSPRSFYGPAPMKTQTWYSPHTGHQMDPPPYTDSPQPYDTGSVKKAAFE